MPPYTKTFIRQKIQTSSPVLRYAVHLKFVSPKKGRYYLYKNIRVVFAHRCPDDNEKLQIVCDYPDEPKYFSYTTRSSANKTSLRQSLQSLSSSGEMEIDDDTSLDGSF